MKRTLPLVLLALTLCIATATAATHTWKGGGGDNSWSNDDNWIGGAPENGESGGIFLVFPATAQSHSTVCDLGAISVKKMTFQGSYTVAETDDELANYMVVGVANADAIVIDSSASPTVTFNTSTSVQLNGRVRVQSGNLRMAGYASGACTFYGPGSTWMEGAVGSVTGDWTIEGGTLHLAKAIPQGGSSFTASAGGTVLVESNLQLNGSEIVAYGGIVTLAPGVVDRAGSIWITNGGAVLASQAGSSLSLDDTVTAGDGLNTLMGDFDLGGVTRTFECAGYLRIFGELHDGFQALPPSSTGGIRKTGDGTLFLSNGGDFHGPVIVEEGEVKAQVATAFGATGGGVQVKQGQTLSLADVAIAGETLTLGGELKVSGSDCSWTGNVVLQSTAQAIGFNGTPDPGSLVIDGVVSGPGTLRMNAPGVLELTGSTSNTFTGETVVESGTILLNMMAANAIPGPLTLSAPGFSIVPKVVSQRDNQIADSAIVYLAGDEAVLDLNSQDETIGALMSGPNGGTVDLGSSRFSPATFSVGANHASTGFYGKIEGASNMTLAKIGNGTLRLGYGGKFNAFSGIARVVDGGLTVDQYQKIGDVFVKPGATLGGEGESGAVTMEGGSLCACHLTAKGDVYAGTGGGHLLVDILGPAAAKGGYDQLKVNGLVSLVGCSLIAAATYSPPAGAKFVIVQNDGTEPVFGSFTGLGEGAQINVSGRPFSISYHGGDGNDVELTYTGVGSGPRVLSVAYDRSGDIIHLQGQAKPGVSCLWQVSSSLKTWSTFATGVPDTAGLVKVDQALGLHAEGLFFRLTQTQ